MPKIVVNIKEKLLEEAKRQLSLGKFCSERNRSIEKKKKK